MHELWLNNEERADVATAIAHCIDTLHDEIRHTDDYDVRVMLKRRRQVLVSVQSRLLAERGFALADVR